jgi:hypothetical protein
MSHSAQSNRSTVCPISESTSAIRAAYKASVRKKKSFHRSSWNSGPVSTPENFPLNARQLSVIGNGIPNSSATATPISSHIGPLTPLQPTPHCRTRKSPSLSTVSATCSSS